MSNVTKPWTKESIEDVVGAMVGYGLSYDDPAGVLAATRTGPNPYDVAQTFEESDVTTTLGDSGVVDSGSITLDLTTGTTADTGSMSGSLGLSGWDAVRITPNTDLPGIFATVGAGANGSEVRIYRVSDSTHVKTFDVAPSGGETVKLEADLSAGTQYDVILQHGGDSSSNDGASDSASSGDVDIDQYVWGDSEHNVRGSDGDPYGWRSVTAITDAGLSESGRVEWPNDRTDIYEYDVATFTATEDGATVDVFAAYNDGTGWQRANGGDPISRHYSLDADPAISPSDNVALEYELSRPDTSYQPRLDSAMVSWRL